jgi:hypothetical protein
VLELRALTRLACDHLEYGNVARAEAVIAARTALADAIAQARYRWQSPLLWSMHAMPRGRFEECETRIVEARRIAAETPDPNAQRCIEFHRFSMLLVAGRPQALKEQEGKTHQTLLTLVGNHDLDDWVTAVTAAQCGDKRRAVEVLRSIGQGRCTARNERATLLEAAVLAGAADFYTALYPQLDSADNTNASWGPFAFACMYPKARVLAMAAFALGREDEAIRHCERALELAERMDADAHRAWVHLTWGEGTGERGRLELALELAQKLDMPAVAERARAAMDKARPHPAGESALPSLALRHDRSRNEWTIEHAGRSFRLKDLRGLRMLAQLVDQPGREIHALDLASEGGGDPGDAAAADLGDAGEVIDLRARNAYKLRIDELREELAEAESFSDSARAASLRGELDALTQQIAAAVGIGGRERRAGSAAERARVAVQRRIREAIKKIAEQDAVLGRHLDWAVRTGTFCAYEPAGRKSAAK